MRRYLHVAELMAEAPAPRKRNLSCGLICANAEYQMLVKGAAKLPVGESKKRVCVTDAKSATRWFNQHAEELGIDPIIS